MTVNIDDLNSENTLGKRFYIRDHGQIIYKYDCYDESIKNLTEDQDIIIEDNNIPYALPEYWYYRNNCPEYIIVRDVSLYDTENFPINKQLFLEASSVTLDDNIVISLQVKHNAHKYVHEGRNMSNVSQLSDVTTNVSEGLEENFTFENIPVHINGMDDTTVDITNGRGSIVLNGANVTAAFLSGYISIPDMQPMYFSVDNIQPIPSISAIKKMEAIREYRNSLLDNCDWMIIRHITQKDINVQTSVSDSDIASLEEYMQELRDLPANIEDIDNVQWPVNPLLNSPQQ